jgi:carboxylesterase
MKIIISLLIMMVGVACSSEPTITKEMLDGGTLFDPSIYKPENYLVSKAIPNPTPSKPNDRSLLPATATRPQPLSGMSCAPGLQAEPIFSCRRCCSAVTGAATMNSGNRPGTTGSRPIMDEYDRLEKAGYKNISLLGSSTSGALLLELVASDSSRTVPLPAICSW